MPRPLSFLGASSAESYHTTHSAKQRMSRKLRFSATSPNSGAKVMRTKSAGDVIGVFTIVTPYVSTHKKMSFHLVECNLCGRQITLRSGRIKHNKSCGCQMTKPMVEAWRTHGRSRTREYNAFVGMFHRCHLASNAHYKNYGQRGIRVCMRWITGGLQQFIADMGTCPPGHTIDRIDNDKGYSPGNCRWATRKQQNRNTRRNRRIEVRGEVLVLMDVAIKYGIHPATISQRVRRGLTGEQLLAPPTKGNPRKHQ